MKTLNPIRASTSRKIAGVALGLILYASATAGLYRFLSHPVRTASASTQANGFVPNQNTRIVNGAFHVDGREFHIIGVGWDPARPGELPWERRMDASVVEYDFARMSKAGFNTVRTWAPLSEEELQLAEKHALKVLQGIWVDPDGDFADPSFRRRALAEAASAVKRSRQSPAVIGYLVMNEPRASAVAQAGLENARSFLRELVATVRALDPYTPIGFASWPGMEALDDDLLDFVAFNLYPHRPRVVMDELGLQGYIRMIKEKIARGRPVLISEFGVSVSPGLLRDGPRRGGATEEQQATELLALSRLFHAAGAAGTAVFQWNDGWWKNNEGPGDERTHDPDDPEEWFGLIRFDEDRVHGTPRAALTALARENRALLLEPRAGQVKDPERVPVRIFAQRPVKVLWSVDGGPKQELELTRRADFLEAIVSIPRAGTRHDVLFELYSSTGRLLHSETRLLRTDAPRAVALSVTRHLVVRPGESFLVEVSVESARPLPRTVTLSAYTEDRFNEDRHQLQLDAQGRASIRLTAPDEQTMLTLLAFEDDRSLPPAERSAAFGVVEVRR